MSEPQPICQDNLLDSLLGDFLDESDQLLTQLNKNLLRLDEWARSLADDHHDRPDPELLNEMFRAAHSLKGLSAMLGLTDINTLTHKIENVFDAARSHQLAVNADVVDLVFLGIDHLTALVELLKNPDGEMVDCKAVLEGIRQLLRSAGAERQPGSQAPAELTAAEQALPGSLAEAWRDVPDPLEDVRDEEDISEKYVAIFIDETERSLDELSEILLALEGGDDARALSKLLVTSHRIKGSAASIGLNRAAKLAHLMEDLLQCLVEDDDALSGEAADALLGCTDALRQFVKLLRQGSTESGHFSDAARKLLACRAPARLAGLRERLDGVVAEIRARAGAAGVGALSMAAGVAAETIERIAAGEDAELAALRLLAAHFDSAEEQPGAAAEDDQEQSRVEAASAAGPTFAGEVRFEADLPAAGLKALLIHEKLSKLGRVVHCDPPAGKLDQIDRLERFRFRVATDQPAEKLLGVVRLSGVREAQVEPYGARAPAAAADCGPADPASRQSAVERATSGPATGQASGPAAGEGSAAEAPPAKRDSRSSTPAEAPAPATSREARSAAAESANRPTETVRVDIDRLDELMNLAGQLVINKAQFTRIGEKLKAALSGNGLAQSLDRAFREVGKLSDAGGHRLDGQHPKEQGQHLHGQTLRIRNELELIRDEAQTINQARGCVKDLLETIHQFDRVSDAVQQAVMDTRMVPIGPLFSRFNRVVRDIARQSQKDIRLEIQGEKTELDKRMIDELSDPLIHLVRNSADHGIEPPEVREAAGKPRWGTVRLEAFHRGNSIVIRASDDGRGLDHERIVRKCVEKGILTEADAERMTPRQIQQMIWVPGMTTAEKVTGVSGRGMGMDIVKSKIEALNGVVDIESVAGRGTTMTIRLPVTLAILPSLMVDIGGDVFAMPMEAVTEIVSVGHDQLSTVHGRPMATVRGRVVSLVRLGEMVRFHRAGRNSDASGRRETTLVIVGEAGRELGLAVDRVIGEEDIVIKSIAENYKNVGGIAGASILGDGRVSLILDIPALIEMVAKTTATAS
jgi:two-component system chemotaxis sensor kinase CheA